MNHDPALVRETAEHVFRVLRRTLETSAARFSWEKAADLAWLALTRPERPGAMLSPEQRRELKETLLVLARGFADPTAPSTLFAFAEAASEAAVRGIKAGRHPGARLNSRLPPPPDNASLVKAALFAEYASAKDDDDLVRRAVTRAMRERKRGYRGMRKVDVEPGDPLRRLLDLPKSGAVYLPKNDVRTHLVEGRGALTGLLREASLFSESVLRPVMGEELWGLCRVVGFSDKRRQYVAVEVRSSALAQEVRMRSRELLERLRRVPGFEGVKDLRFEVKAAPRTGGR